MSLIKDISNQTFGSLTVVKLIGTDKHNKSIWECRCDCGKLTSVTSNNLKRGITKSCGCRHTLFKTNEIGKRYGRLKVISTGKDGGWWNVECDCGNTITIRGATLRKSESCGCKGGIGKLNSKWTGYEDIDGKYWANIIASAKRRNLAFEIDIQYAWDIYIQQNRKCAISGTPISFKCEGAKKLKRTASIDRIDSSKGYVFGNIQWLLQDVNYMKRKLKDSDFIQLCKLVANHQLKQM